MRQTFVTKNGGESDKQFVKCTIVRNKNSNILQCTSCTDPNSDENPNDPYLPKNLPKDEIKKILAKAQSEKRRIGRSFKSNAVRQGLSVPQWIQTEPSGQHCFKFLIINNDPANVDQTMLESIANAIEKDCHERFVLDYGLVATFSVVGPEAMKDPKNFQGDQVPIFVGRYGQGAFHYIDTPEPANTYSFPVAGGSLSGYGIKLPAGSNMDYIPYSIISSDSIPDFMSPASNVYGISPESLKNCGDSTIIQNPGYQIMSIAISHESKEIMGNDTTLNWVMFDHYAPTVAYWHWGEFDSSPIPNCTNGVKNKTTGYVELPKFLEVFPNGGLLFAVREVGDVVSAGFAGLFNSYNVDGWLMENYPTMNFWKPYNDDPNVRYDAMGHVARPLEPYGGMHQLVFFISFDDGKTRYMEVQNKGPVTADMRKAPPSNNFPPDYVYCRQLGIIKPGMNVLSMIGGLENYGPSKADRT